MVVASPYHKYLRLTDSVYQNTDILLLRLLRERLCAEGSKTQFFTLLLPYCTEKDIHSDAINLKRFSFPNDLNNMLKFIHNEWKLPECLSPGIEGGKESYKLFGSKLSNAIEEAQVDLRKNKLEYQRMVEEIANEKDNVDSDQEILTYMKQEKDNSKFFDRPVRIKKMLKESAPENFGEFPGRIDEMNLLGEENESLVDSGKKFGNRIAINLQELDL